MLVNDVHDGELASYADTSKYSSLRKQVDPERSRKLLEEAEEKARNAFYLLPETKHRVTAIRLLLL